MNHDGIQLIWQICLLFVTLFVYNNYCIQHFPPNYNIFPTLKYLTDDKADAMYVDDRRQGGDTLDNL